MDLLHGAAVDCSFAQHFIGINQKMYCGKQCLKKMQELIPDLQVADTVNDYDKLIFKLVYGNEQYEL